jgi:hypothetical protein
MILAAWTLTSMLFAALVAGLSGAPAGFVAGVALLLSPFALAWASRPPVAVRPAEAPVRAPHAARPRTWPTVARRPASRLPAREQLVEIGP